MRPPVIVVQRIVACRQEQTKCGVKCAQVGVGKATQPTLRNDSAYSCKINVASVSFDSLISCKGAKRGRGGCSW